MHLVPRECKDVPPERRARRERPCATGLRSCFFYSLGLLGFRQEMDQAAGMETCGALFLC